MKELSLQQKIDFCNWYLKIIKEYSNNKSVGFCWHIASYIETVLNKYIIGCYLDSVNLYFPELLKYKSKNTCSYWFEHNDKDSRIEIIKKVLIELNK